MNFDKHNVAAQIRHFLGVLGFKKSDISKTINAYNESHRHYHNLEHIAEMLNFVDNPSKIFELTGDEKVALRLAVIFHDVVYDTTAKNNEEASYEFFLKCVSRLPLPKYPTTEYWDMISSKVKEMILATKSHDYSENLPAYTKAIILADLERLTLPFPLLWNNTKALMKEYAFVDFEDFKNGRLEFFKSYKEKIKFLGKNAQNNIERAYHTLQVWQPKIAAYPGSFNPFHPGHLRILQKAELIFDKVIIARGVNPDKDPSSIEPLPERILKNYQIDQYHGLLSDYIKSKAYPLTVIRGLRNATDLQYEITQYRYLQDLMPEIQVVSIFSDADVEHLSSSGIRKLEEISFENPYKI